DDAPGVIADIFVRVSSIPAHATTHPAIVEMIERLLHRLLGAGPSFLNAIIRDIRGGAQQRFGIAGDVLQIVTQIPHWGIECAVSHGRPPGTLVVGRAVELTSAGS